MGSNSPVTQANGWAQLFFPALGGNLSINQGNGDGDQATVQSNTVEGNLSVTQAGDRAEVFFPAFGAEEASGSVRIALRYAATCPSPKTAAAMWPRWESNTVEGNLLITQGNRNGQIIDDGNAVVGNVFIN